MPFLLAYFKGWETFQTSNAAIVLREESGVVTHFAFGALQNYYRLYLLCLTAYKNISASLFSYRALLHLLPSFQSYAVCTLSGISLIMLPLSNVSYPNFLALSSSPTSFLYSLILFPYSCLGV